MLNNFYSETVRAIDFPAHLEWLNTAQKYSLKDFKGKIVLLDFWTYCCINCMHVIPDLKRLEGKYPQLIVIGVHSAKFHNERIKENIQQAILRYDIEHPVVIDNEFVLWRAYGINAWPSFVVIDPAGKVVEQTSGERIFKRFDTIIGSLSQEFQEKGLLNRERFQFQLLKDTVPQSVLYFPGKITAHSASKRLFFTDSNHNRIIVANPDGEIIDIVGSGEPGRSDGDFNTATFFRPQGLAFDEKRNCLYVADTENHLIRKADFTAKRVTTILGTEVQTRFMKESERGTDVQLNSPWDIIILGDYLY
ncbi:MAG: thioredoxin-like domain-containing protein, partial [Candidatus Aminicenantes bacterium]|nr:thioredoxin-like domain-containing protein [Candidatus Aminicenantes bacterium]